MSKIIEELKFEKQNYKMSIKGYLFGIFTHLKRHYVVDLNMLSNQRKKILNTIKNSLLFMDNNFHRQITLDEICSHVNISKYYYCKIKKQMIKMEAQ